MRFLNISGPGVAQDEDFCPNCHVLLDERHDYKTCPLCKYDTRQGVRQRRVQMWRR
jgi:ribosomal protein S27AE